MHPDHLSIRADFSTADHLDKGVLEFQMRQVALSVFFQACPFRR